MRHRGLSIVRVVLLGVALIAAAESVHAVTVKSYSTYLGETRPVLHQWWNALEGSFAQHFLTEPLASNTENPAEMQQLLHQWWNGLEAKRGFHFLTEPLSSNTDTTIELHNVLNQWQNAIESWFGYHLLLEPPSPYANATKTAGDFDLSPRKASVDAGDAVHFGIDWTVPAPNNWHDLSSIEMQICKKEPLLWIRWDELTNSLTLLDSLGVPAATGVIGASGTLENEMVSVSLAGSSTVGSGPTGPSVLLNLLVEFKPAGNGRSCDVALAGSDDLGHVDDFKHAGKIGIGVK